jgi:hypothetical protein
MWRPTCISARISGITRQIFIGAKHISSRYLREKLNTLYERYIFRWVLRFYKFLNALDICAVWRGGKRRKHHNNYALRKLNLPPRLMTVCKEGCSAEVGLRFPPWTVFFARGRSTLDLHSLVSCAECVLQRQQGHNINKRRKFSP